MTIVEDAYGYIDELPVSYMATSVDDQPYVRPMMLINRGGGRFYYATFSNDKKFEQVTQNPKVEICVLLGEGENGGSLRIRGEIEFVTNEDVRQEVWDCVGFTQSFWDNPQDPAFILMQIKPSYLELMRPGTMDIERTEV